MLNAMRDAEPFGFFVGRSGEPVDLQAFSNRINARPVEVRKLLAELTTKGVAEVDRLGRIFSRRLVRDFARSQAAAEFGAQGGNPVLSDNPSLKGSLKPSDKASLKPRVRNNAPAIPEARNQSNSDSLRSSAIGFGDWPQQIEPLRALALLFVAEFANCRDAGKAEKHVAAYTPTLASMRSRGVTIAAAWQACVDARDACGGRPLWGAGVKTALSFLPARGALPAPQPTPDQSPAWLDQAIERGRADAAKRPKPGGDTACGA